MRRQNIVLDNKKCLHLIDFLIFNKLPRLIFSFNCSNRSDTYKLIEYVRMLIKKIKNSSPNIHN